MSDRVIGILGLALGVLGLGIQLVFPGATLFGWLCILGGVGLLGVAFGQHREGARHNRPYVAADRRTMAAVYDGRTHVEGDQLFKLRYKGQWIAVEGSVRNVQWFLLWLEVEIASLEQGAVYLRFRRRHQRRVRALQIGERIRAEGRITSAQHSLSLKQCAFLTLNPATPQSLPEPTRDQ
jgi:hypothetical protein